MDCQVSWRPRAIFHGRVSTSSGLAANFCHVVIVESKTVNTFEEVNRMTIPSFTAEASLYKTGGNYRTHISGSLEKGLRLQALIGIAPQPFGCQLICERVFENGVSFERCRVECPDGGGGDGDFLGCRERCLGMGLSQFECMRLCMGQP